MSIKIGINGLGRIGLMVMRESLNHPEIEIAAINASYPPEYLAYTLKYDTMHGRFPGEVSYGEKCLIVNGKEIPIVGQRDPALLPWCLFPYPA